MVAVHLLGYEQASLRNSFAFLRSRRLVEDPGMSRSRARTDNAAQSAAWPSLFFHLVHAYMSPWRLMPAHQSLPKIRSCSPGALRAQASCKTALALALAAFPTKVFCQRRCFQFTIRGLPSRQPLRPDLTCLTKWPGPRPLRRICLNVPNASRGNRFPTRLLLIQTVRGAVASRLDVPRSSSFQPVDV